MYANLHLALFLMARHNAFIIHAGDAASMAAADAYADALRCWCGTDVLKTAPETWTFTKEPQRTSTQICATCACGFRPKFVRITTHTTSERWKLGISVPDASMRPDPMGFRAHFARNRTQTLSKKLVDFTSRPRSDTMCGRARRRIGITNAAACENFAYLYKQEDKVTRHEIANLSQWSQK